MFGIRVVVVGASLAGLFVLASCLPTYVWNEAPEDGGGGSSTSGGGGTGDGTGGAGGQVPPPEGPYGPEAIYFGEPEVEPSFAGPYAIQGGSISPDGLRFVQGWTNKSVHETPRQSSRSGWEDAYAPHYTFFELHPRLSGDNRTLYSCHGGEKECMMHRREGTGPDDDFVGVHWFQDSPPFEGDAYDDAFTPTPTGHLLAFSSNRAGPTDGSIGTEDRDLWIASASAGDPYDPPRHYSGLEKVPASLVGRDEHPSWLSDDGLTLIFYAGPEDQEDLFLVSRPSTDVPFGSEVQLPMSRPDTSERELTLPSIATLQAAGQAYAYYEVTAPVEARAWMRVPVCIGAPCSP
jgi:hypothetical protein